jgi:hypothetical protein
MKSVLAYFSSCGSNVTLLRGVEGLCSGVGSLRISINTLPACAICDFPYIEDPILGMMFVPCEG